MSINRTNDDLSQLRMTLDQFDELIENFYKLNALLKLALSSRLDLLTSEILYYIFWIIDDLLYQLGLPLLKLEAKKPKT